ncbi:MAG: Clp1/GlmU family protein [bacterium]
MKFKNGDIIIVKGPAEIKIKKGLCSIVGAEFETGYFEIHQGKSIPVEMRADSEIEVSGKFDRLESSTIPEKWHEIAESFAKKKPRVVLVLGEIDTGKTFFSTFLANSLLGKNIKVSIVDCDVGQSDIGPPGTLGLAVLSKPVVFIADEKPASLFYLGSHSPGLHLTSAVVGVKKLVDEALKHSQVVLIDTPGWVQGDGGRLLRNSEIDILNPDKIMLLERGRELEHLVKREPASKIERIRVSKKATSTTDADRKLLREKIAEKYYQSMRKLEFSFDNVTTDRAYLLTGERIEPGSVKVLWAERLSGWEGILVATAKPLTGDEIAALKKEFSVFKVKNIVKGVERNMVVGLLDKDKACLGLGIMEEINYSSREFVLWVPIREDTKVKILQFGSIKFSPEMKEAGFVEPGYF